MKTILLILLSPLLLSAQDVYPDTLRLASIEQHPVFELFPCGKKQCYVGLKISANSRLSREFLKCELCTRYFQVADEISFIIAYTDGANILAQFAHHRCIEDYQKKVKRE